MAKWEGIDPARWAALQPEKLNRVRKKYAFSLHDAFVKRSPVDSGQFRNAWGISVGHDDTTTTKGTISGLDNVTGDQSIYIYNNLPYARKIEFGLFTSKPETEKTIGGYSKQAPTGVVGVTLAQSDKILDAIVKVEGGT